MLDVPGARPAIERSRTTAASTTRATGVRNSMRPRGAMALLLYSGLEVSSILYPRWRPIGFTCIVCTICRCLTQRFGQLEARRHAELAVGPREVSLDRLHINEEFVGDRAVGDVRGRHVHGPQLGRR